MLGNEPRRGGVMYAKETRGVMVNDEEGRGVAVQSAVHGVVLGNVRELDQRRQQPMPPIQPVTITEEYYYEEGEHGCCRSCSCCDECRFCTCCNNCKCCTGKCCLCALFIIVFFPLAILAIFGYFYLKNVHNKK